LTASEGMFNTKTTPTAMTTMMMMTIPANGLCKLLANLSPPSNLYISIEKGTNRQCLEVAYIPWQPRYDCSSTDNALQYVLTQDWRQP